MRSIRYLLATIEKVIVAAAIRRRMGDPIGAHELLALVDARDRLLEDRERALDLFAQAEAAIATGGRGEDITHLSTAQLIERLRASRRINIERDDNLFRVSDADWDAFMAILDNPAGPDPAVMKLARSKAPWDTDK